MCTASPHRKTTVVVWVCCMIGAVVVFNLSPAYAGNGTTPQPPSPTIPRPPADPIPPPSSPVPNPPKRSQLGADAVLQADTKNPADTNENQQEKENQRENKDSLSKKLDENEGVIEPPRVGDSEIVEPAPDTNAKIKVIPPPGEPGGNPNIQPK